MSPGQRKRSVNWRTLGAAVALCAVMLPAAGRTAAHAQAVHAAPSLVQMAARHPGATLHVIVQKRGPTSTPDSIVRETGGKITKDLSIINAVAATIPASALHTLAVSTSVNWISPDAQVRHMGFGPDGAVDTSNLQNSYDRSIGADTLWHDRYQGGRVNVAVVDSGVNSTSDLGGSRLVASVSVNSTDSSVTDGYGHGTHVAGIIAGSGFSSDAPGQFIGIAPKAGVVSVKVFNNQGQGTVSDVVSGLQWIYDNRSRYNIKVVNLSLDTTLSQSYNNDPLDAACEILWFNKIVVVTAAGNNQSTSPGRLTSPANDPFVITVGAVDDQGTSTPADDTLASFSTHGTTVDGFAKPDLVAPGVDIISTLASQSDILARNFPSHVDDGSYFDMSGTSMAAPMVSGAAALLLEKYPSLTPDQVKNRLMSTASQISSRTGAGEVNVAAAYADSSDESSNIGLAPSAGLQTGLGTNFRTWDSASWGLVSWGSASWGSASWGSASWGSSSWGSDFWGKTRKHPHGNDNNDKVHG